MTQVKLFTAKIIDEYGNSFPQARCGILEVELLVRKGRKIGAIDSGDEYTNTAGIAGGSFKIMYWGSEQTRLDSFKSRPLMQTEDDSFTPVFSIDTTQPLVQAIIDGPLTGDDETDEIVRVELERIFS